MEELIKQDADPSIVNQPGVRDEIDRIGQRMIQSLSEYADDFIEKRFPAGLPEKMHSIIKEIVLDAFHDGAMWAEAQRENEQRIILAAP